MSARADVNPCVIESKTISSRTRIHVENRSSIGPTDQSRRVCFDMNSLTRFSGRSGRRNSAASRRLTRRRRRYDRVTYTRRSGPTACAGGEGISSGKTRTRHVGRTRVPTEVNQKKTTARRAISWIRPVDACEGPNDVMARERFFIFLSRETLDPASRSARHATLGSFYPYRTRTISFSPRQRFYARFFRCAFTVRACTTVYPEGRTSRDYYFRLNRRLDVRTFYFAPPPSLK